MDKIKEQFNLEYNDRFLIENDECRHLWINRDIDDDALDDIVYSIFRYNRLDKDIDPNKRVPIIIYINTSGGDVTAGFSIINAISESATPVYTVNIGRAYSMGFLIMLAGKKRYAMKNSSFLMHDGSTGGIYDSTAKAQDLMEFTKETEFMIRNYVITHTSITNSEYEKVYRREWYFYPEEAKKYSVIDYIVGEDCELKEIL